MLAKIKGQIWFFRVIFHIHLLYILIKIFPPSPITAARMSAEIDQLIKELEEE